MPKFEINATELKDVDMSFVALVKRGANRIPFRVTKGDGEMLDLYSLGRRLFKTAEAAPAVVAIIAKQDGLNQKALGAVAEAIGWAGAPLKKSAKDGVITFAKGELPKDGLTVIKLDDSLALVVTGDVKKSFTGYDFTSTAFSDVMATGGFCMGVSNAADQFRCTVANIMEQSDSADAARGLINKACDDYKAYLDGLLASIPVHAFKADVAISKVAGNGGAKGGAATNQETGDGLGDKANGGASTTMKGDENIAGGDINAKDPLMPGKDVKKDAAGLNGTGQGAEMGAGTETNSKATTDDAENTPDTQGTTKGKTTGDDSGMPAKAKAPTTKGDDPIALAKAALEQAQKALSAAEAAAGKNKGNTTDGDETGLPAKAKAPTKKEDGDGDNDAVDGATAGTGQQRGNGGGGAHTFDVTTITPTGESQAGEGAAQGPDESDAAKARGTADDKNAGKGGTSGSVGGATLEMSGVPDKAKSPTTKNDGDADVGKKGKGNELPETQSGAGAQEKDVQTLKSESAQLMQAIQSLSKSVQESIAGVTKTVEALSTRVDGVTAMAKKTDAALHGTVFNVEPEDVSQARKADAAAAKEPPLLDTGYSRRSA